MRAIAAISLNRVIGKENKIPWHLPDDLKWFKQITQGGILVMGRKTFESIGKPLPGRETFVLTRGHWTHPDVKTASIPELLSSHSKEPRPLFVCGGAEIYNQLLPYCSDLYLTVVNQVVEGDAFFTEFESLFKLKQIILKNEEFEIHHYRIRETLKS